jgi:D-alanyl-D-alanine carboxypeptidase/D-alanyl-D-alanine-endopeptidase (penicillin-binding protein 4)
VLLGVLAVVPTVALLAVNRWASARADEGEPVPAQASQPGPSPVTPLLSARRVPSAVQAHLGVSALQSSLAPIGERVGAGSCLTVGVDGTEVFDDGGATAVMPASNQKLVTAAVALEALGPDFAYETVVSASGRDGATVADLHLVGGGDPLLGTQAYVLAAAEQDRYPQPVVTSLETLADQVVAAGITDVTGRVLADESRYDAERRVPSWPESYATEAGALSAVTVNDGYASLTPLARTADPVTHAASVFTDLLRQRGVRIAGAPGAATAPADATPVASIRSLPLSEIVAEMLTTSDDMTAELVVKEIGKAASGTGTREAGLGAMAAALSSWGLPTDGMVLVDGSGLDRGNRLSCDLLLGVLDHGGPDGPVADGLAVAGQTGSMEPYLKGTASEGRLRAKTGTLTGAKALSGFVTAVDGENHVTFSYVENSDNAEGIAVPLWTDLGNALAAYPQAPARDDLAPVPVD